MTTNLSIWISGPFGKMGTALRTVLEDVTDISITGIVSPEHSGQTCDIAGTSMTVHDSLEDLAQSSPLPDVIVDFTFAKVAYEGALFAAKNDIDFVTGTTGMTPDQKQEVIEAFSTSKGHAIIASNFSLGAVLMMHFAAQAAQHFTHAEIVETHHTQKKDAPSGTAITTRTMMAENSPMSGNDIPIHSLRLPGAIAHQQVHLSSPGEILRLEHDANDRSCFMPGIILAIRHVHGVDGAIFSIESLLFPDDDLKQA